MTCTCPHIRVGSEVTESRTWGETCPEHGVGTEYFRALNPKPFGYAELADWTREQWLEWLRQPEGGEA
jgi:hypothetical protein